MKDEKVAWWIQLRGSLNHSSFRLHPSSLLLLSGEGDDLFGGVLHAAGDRKVHARLFDHALALFDVGSFKADDHGDADIKILSRADHSVGHHIAAHDAA